MLYVFDLDGTLADTAGDLIGTLDYVMIQEGFDETPIDDARSLLGAGARALIVRALAAARPGAFRPNKLEEMFQLFLVHYESRIADDSRLYPGVVEALDALEKRGGVFRRLHQQDRAPGQDCCWKSSAWPIVSPSSAARTLLASPSPIRMPLLRTIEAGAAARSGAR